MFCGFALAGFSDSQRFMSAVEGRLYKAFVIGAVLSVIGLVITFIYRAMKKNAAMAANQEQHENSFNLIEHIRDGDTQDKNHMGFFKWI